MRGITQILITMTTVPRPCRGTAKILPTATPSGGIANFLLQVTENLHILGNSWSHRPSPRRQPHRCDQRWPLTRCCHRGHRERRDRCQLVRDDLRSDEEGGHNVGGRCALLLIIAWSHVQRSAIYRAAKSWLPSVGWYEPSYGLSKSWGLSGGALSTLEGLLATFC